MSHRIGEDARLDVYRCLNRFEVDPIQCVSWESHIFLANRTNRLPVRLLDEAEIDGRHMSVSARDATRGSVSFDGTQQEAFQRGLAAIENSDLKRLTLLDPAGRPISDGELERVTKVAASVNVADLRLWCDLEHLSPQSLHRLMFGFARVKALCLQRISGNQLTDDLLHECGLRQILDLSVATKDAGPAAVGDEAVLDYLFAPEYGNTDRELALPAFNASPQFVQKLVKRAQQATNIGKIHFNVWRLPQKSQQLGGLHLTESEGITEYEELRENGVLLKLYFNATDLFVANYR